MEQRFKLSGIYNGWKNYLFPNQKVEKLAKGRALICAQCPDAVYGTYEKLMKDWTLKEVKGMKCNQCGCPLSTKLRNVDEQCPKGLW